MGVYQVAPPEYLEEAVDIQRRRRRGSHWSRLRRETHVGSKRRRSPEPERNCATRKQSKRRSYSRHLGPPGSKPGPIPGFRALPTTRLAGMPALSPLVLALDQPLHKASDALLPCIAPDFGRGLHICHIFLSASARIRALSCRRSRESECYFSVIRSASLSIARSNPFAALVIACFSPEKTLSAARIIQEPATPKLAPASSRPAARKWCPE
jgi:hypothetical protein